MNTKHKRIHHIVNLVKAELPDATFEVDESSRTDAPSFVDIDANGRKVVLEFRPKLGFGVTSAPADSYGEGPDEFFEEDDNGVAKRLLALLRSGEQTAPQRVRLLQELREHRQVSQVSLAARLGVRQPTVSKIERRDDVALSTLRRYIEALGGRLVVAAQFVDGRVEIALDDDQSLPA
jgi:DNA-binding XRE family transcriptional regulator